MEGGEWSNFNAAVCVNEEADFMAQLFPNNSNDVNSNYGHNHSHNNNNYHRNNTNNVDGGSSYYSPDSTTSNSQNMYRYNSQESSYSNTQHHDEVHYHNYFSDNNNHNNHSSLPIDFLHCHIEDESGVNVDLNDDLEPSLEDKSMGKTKKRPRALEVQKVMKKNLRVKRSQSSLSLGGEDEKENGTLVHNHISRCESLDDDDCSSKGTSTTTKTTTTTTTTALNSSGKTRASRGSATDPQSLYARKRRERINERLRILQSLVPNGTKVDISTMLEEAVHYVKFLQLQIKLLSSDELWMYAPIAYNGMNIGLDFQFNSPR